MKEILIVEDEPTLVTLVQEFVTKRMPNQASQPELIHIASGEEAIRLLESREALTFDGLMVGRYNPENDGLKIITLFRTRFPQAHIALFSGENDKTYVDEAIRCGANVHIPKPVDLAKLQTFFLQILYKNATTV
ncbi:MAG: Transcriptional regulatory protein [Parcubacteria group bacterium GW2011_GWA2_47_16]|nr:MAG: Transcriptional regulatory protein [Parcubacteria group bacterium GW2011_GWA2_47_16]